MGGKKGREEKDKDDERFGENRVAGAERRKRRAGFWVVKGDDGGSEKKKEKEGAHEKK